MEEYAKPIINEDKLYMIDKVVRLRGQEGRFGVDHSELLNFEFEMANKDRSNHLNMLVYQNQGIPYSTSLTPTKTNSNKENYASTMASKVLLDRLSVRD
jgi:hypothetical protein